MTIFLYVGLYALASCALTLVICLGMRGWRRKRRAA